MTSVMNPDSQDHRFIDELFFTDENQQAMVTLFYDRLASDYNAMCTREIMRIPEQQVRSSPFGIAKALARRGLRDGRDFQLRHDRLAKVIYIKRITVRQATSLRD